MGDYLAKKIGAVNGLLLGNFAYSSHNRRAVAVE